MATILIYDFLIWFLILNSIPKFFLIILIAFHGLLFRLIKTESSFLLININCILLQNILVWLVCWELSSISRRSVILFLLPNNLTLVKHRILKIGLSKILMTWHWRSASLRALCIYLIRSWNCSEAVHRVLLLFIVFQSVDFYGWIFKNSIPLNSLFKSGLISLIFIKYERAVICCDIISCHMALNVLVKFRICTWLYGLLSNKVIIRKVSKVCIQLMIATPRRLLFVVIRWL